MKKQIKDLSLHEVDYLVAKAEGLNPTIKRKICIIKDNDDIWMVYSPTTNPSQAWPIIEREGINIYWMAPCEWCSETAGGDSYAKGHGKTSLEAAMRCYLASKFRDEVEI